MKRLAGVLGRRTFEPIGEVVGHRLRRVGDVAQVRPNPTSRDQSAASHRSDDEQSGPRVERQISSRRSRAEDWVDGVNGYADVALPGHRVHHG